MLIGGFYSIDMSLLNKNYDNNFKLPLDISNIYPEYIYTNNGRTSTLYALEQLKYQTNKRTILLPDYLCLSVITSIEPSGFNYAFYKINRDLSINLESLQNNIDENTAAIYIINYFGIPPSRYVCKMLKSIARNKGIYIIEDITQSLFSSSSSYGGYGDYIVASTRKWFPMTDGGICCIHKNVSCMDIPLGNPYNEASYKELLISIVRTHYSLNEDLDKTEYLKFENSANASRYKDMTIRGMTDESKSILFNSDIDNLIKVRRENYAMLFNGLKDNLNIEIIQSNILDYDKYVPFGFLILVQNRDDFYNYLVEHGVIPEIQWKLPLDKYNPGDDARYMSDHNIMIQCDQRYSQFEMQYVVDVINDYNF